MPGSTLSLPAWMESCPGASQGVSDEPVLPEALGTWPLEPGACQEE